MKLFLIQQSSTTVSLVNCCLGYQLSVAIRAPSPPHRSWIVSQGSLASNSQGLSRLFSCMSEKFSLQFIYFLFYFHSMSRNSAWKKANNGNRFFFHICEIEFFKFFAWYGFAVPARSFTFCWLNTINKYFLERKSSSRLFDILHCLGSFRFFTIFHSLNGEKNNCVYDTRENGFCFSSDTSGEREEEENDMSRDMTFSFVYICSKNFRKFSLFHTPHSTAKTDKHVFQDYFHFTLHLCLLHVASIRWRVNLAHVHTAIKRTTRSQQSLK